MNEWHFGMLLASNPAKRLPSLKKTVLAACHAKHHRDTNAAQNVFLFWVLQDKKKRRIKYDKKAKPVRET